MAPELGATFVPGGFDDYYMPEVVAPSPQRYASHRYFCSKAAKILGVYIGLTSLLFASRLG